MKVTTVSGATMAAAAASLFVSGMAMAPELASAKPAMGHCMAANACKGMSACKGGAPGLNACKGQGFAMLTKGACQKSATSSKRHNRRGRRRARHDVEPCIR